MMHALRSRAVSPSNPNEVLITSHRIVSPDYLKTLGVTLMSGRFIDENDRAGSLPVVVISEELARQRGPDKIRSANG